MAQTHACVLLSLFLLLTFTSAQSPAPGPAADCSMAVLSLADCLSFVQKGSTVKKPEGTCCSSLKTVLKEDAACLCEGFKSSASFGLQLDMAKALALPKACGVKAPPLSNCGISAADMGPSPASAPSPLSGDTPSGSGSSVGVPAPTPGATNSATKHHVPAVVSLLAGMAAVACF